MRNRKVFKKKNELVVAQSQAVRLFVSGRIDHTNAELLRPMNWDRLERLIDKNDWQDDESALTNRELIRAQLLSSACRGDGGISDFKIVFEFRRNRSFYSKSSVSGQTNLMDEDSLGNKATGTRKAG